MLLPLLMPLFWAGDWVPGAHLAVSAGLWGAYSRPILSFKVPESVTVQEGLCVFVPCTFFNYFSWMDIPAPEAGYWFREGADTNLDFPVATSKPEGQVQKETQGRFLLPGVLWKNNCSLDIRDAQRRDNGSYFFWMDSENVKWNYFGNLISVHVTALTHTPHIDIPQTLEPGHPSNLTCSVPWACERGTPPIFSWVSSASTALGPRTMLSSVVTLKPRPQDHGTSLTCRVTFPGVGVITESTVRLNVSYTEQTPTAPASASRGAAPGRSGPLAEVILVAMGEAALKVLLLGLCLILFRVKPCRKKMMRPAVHRDYDTVMS